MRYLALLAAVPVIASAAHCFIWNTSPTDTIYDAEAGRTVDHLYWLIDNLTDLGHTFDVDTHLTANLDNYDLAFAMCGWYNC